MGKKLPAATVEKPPAIDSFVKHGASRGHSGTQVPDARSNTRRTGGDGKERERVAVWVRVETKQKLLMHCAAQRLDQGEVVDAAIVDYLRKHKG